MRCSSAHTATFAPGLAGPPLDPASGNWWPDRCCLRRPGAASGDVRLADDPAQAFVESVVVDPKAACSLHVCSDVPVIPCQSWRQLAARLDFERLDGSGGPGRGAAAPPVTPLQLGGDPAKREVDGD